MHPYLENRMAIGRAVVYFAQAARIFSAGIKCRHCSFKNVIGTCRLSIAILELSKTHRRSNFKKCNEAYQIIYVIG